MQCNRGKIRIMYRWKPIGDSAPCQNGQSAFPDWFTNMKQKLKGRNCESWLKSSKYIVLRISEFPNHEAICSQLGWLAVVNTEKPTLLESWQLGRVNSHLSRSIKDPESSPPLLHNHQQLLITITHYLSLQIQHNYPSSFIRTTVLE